MKKNYRKYIIWLLVIAGIGALVTYKVIEVGKKKKKLAMTKSNVQPPITVNAFVVKTQRLENGVLSTGTAIANESVSLQPETSGRITQINIKEGGVVQKGALLVKLFDADLQAQMRKLKLQQELALKTEQRLKELLTINAVSQQEYDVALNGLNAIKADMDLIQANIQKTEIRAPFSGRMGFRNVSEGSFIAPGTIVTTIQQLQPIRIEFSIPEKYLQVISEHRDISFTIDGSDNTFTAPVYAIDPMIDQNTRTIRIRALFKNTKTEILPGSFVKIMMPLESIDNAIMIPTEAVIPEIKGEKVFIIKNGKAFSQKIETGIRNDSTIQVLTGLQPGDTVLTTGIMQLKQGSDLKIVEIK